MNKSYLLVICLFLTSFTGCIEDPDLEPAEKVDEIKDESDNTNNIVDETNNTEEKTEERPTNQWTFYREFVECDTNNNSIVAYGEFVDCLNMDLVNDGESMVAASSEFANEVFSIADLDVDGNLTSSEFDYIKNYPHEAEEGCMDSNANNFNANATEEDNTCDYDLDDDGVLDADEILGCTDSTALNYNSEATDEDGTCFHFQPETKDELQTAVDEWIANSTSANSTYGEINTWDTSLITDMSELFYDEGTFNGDISDWDVSSVTSIGSMFDYAYSFNQDISNWDVSSVTDMQYMFWYASSFNQDISGWDVSSVTNMKRMFDNTDDLSDDNKCYIHTSFSSNDNWYYNWDEYCD